MSDRPSPMPAGNIARNPRGRCLGPWAAPATGAPGWQVTTRSRRLAGARTTLLDETAAVVTAVGLLAVAKGARD